MLFFFSSRRRHTRCALVTGVQTCALPILTGKRAGPQPSRAVYRQLEEMGRTGNARIVVADRLFAKVADHVIGLIGDGRSDGGEVFLDTGLVLRGGRDDAGRANGPVGGE